jgi:hypothetical protein
MNLEPKTQKEKEAVIARIDKAMFQLAEQKAKLEQSLLPLSEQVVRGTWVIKKDSNRHYQVGQTTRVNTTNLIRHDGNTLFTNHEFNRDFRLANLEEIEAHIRFLKSKNRSFITDDTIMKPKTLLQAMTGQSLSESINPYTWVIEKNSNTYYQFISTTFNKSVVYLNRHGEVKSRVTSEFNKEFRLANGNEVIQHEEYLKTSGKYYIPRTAKSSFDTQAEQRKKSIAFIDRIIKEKGLETILHDFGVRTIGGVKNISFFAKEHQEIVKSPFDITKCDFYLVTCRGIMGAKVRHTDYATAEKEAIRIAKKENHETWVLGVVSSIKPSIETTVTKR